ncbi:MAG: 50S ribosomal protein L35ae [Candidatus Helarchaeales archaeon]
MSEAPVEILKGKEGIIMNFRRSRHHQYLRHVLIKFPGDDGPSAAKYIGKTVIWETRTGKQLKGKIVSLHGRKGVVRAIFEKALTGEALGTKVRIK